MEYMNTTMTSNVTKPNLETEQKLMYLMSVLPFLSIVVSIVVIIRLARHQTSGTNFFKWKVIHRFTFYNVICDLFYSISKFAFSIQRIVFKSIPQYIVCSVYTMISFEFSYAQVFVALVMACYGCLLICKNRHLKLGRYDSWFLIPSFSIPAITFVLALIFGQIQAANN